VNERKWRYKVTKIFTKNRNQKLSTATLVANFSLFISSILKQIKQKEKHG
jgi:hypothetical protein